jgi:mono/diheme cytochrome c family protein
VKILRGFSSVAVVIAALALCSAMGEKGQAAAHGSSSAGTRSGDAKNGKKIYVKYGCYECHGREGQGSSVSGPRLGPNPVQFAVFVRYVRQPAGEMPPYTEKVMSEQELADVYAFLQSLRHPQVTNSSPPGN